jgi:YhcH/YjgK/YiaL family protein
MILDTLDNLKMYTGLNPLFPKVVEFIQSHDLSSMPLCKTAIIGDELYLTIADAQPKSQEEAVVETHRQMIDIQIPLSGTETHGFAPLSSLEEATYQEQDDISFYTRPPQTFLSVCPGEFVIFFPQDGHAPAITPVVLRKAIFKVKNQKTNI